MYSPHHYQSKFSYYLKHILAGAIPNAVYRRKAERLLAGTNALADPRLQKRLRYYIRLDKPFCLDASANTLEKIDSSKHSAYFYDLRESARCFPPDRCFYHLFGDVTEVPEKPCLVKSRPIGSYNHNSVLMKFNRIRHFNFIHDEIRFREKIPAVVWRGKAKPHRFRSDVVSRYYRHPECDIGQSNPVPAGCDRRMQVPFMPIREQLAYRYVLSMEGNDVATNLKWIMASNSLCLMRKPRFETWFMEGTLIPGYHYVELRNDHADLVDQISYYNDHPEEAERIIANANAYVQQFMDPNVEKLLELLVLSRYFELSGQMHSHSPVVFPRQYDPSVESSLTGIL